MQEMANRRTVVHEGKVSQKGVMDIADSIWSAEYSVGMGDAGRCSCCLP